MDWDEHAARAIERYEGGAGRDLDQRQLTQLANAAWAAALDLVMAGRGDEARDWFRRAAERYRESWDAGAATDAWGRPIGAMKALLIAGDDASGPARWALAVGAVEADSPIGRYAGVLALLVLGRDEEAVALAATFGEDFPEEVSGALRALAVGDPDAYRAAVAGVRRSFETRDAFLEDVPVPDTAFVLDALAAQRGLA